MSDEAREFLDENGYDLHKDSLYVMDEELGEVFPINVDIPNLLDEYFAFRLGKMIFDGEIKRCKNEEG